MVKKWGLLSRPLQIKLKKLKHLVMAIGKLHSFCINKRLPTSNSVFTPQMYPLTGMIQKRDDSSFFQFEENKGTKIHGPIIEIVW
jgi:hypothetical protein